MASLTGVAVECRLNLETVLVVDDDAAVRAALKFALEVEGFRVRVYDSAAALLADDSLPVRACLVIDYRMPDIDGLELVDRLRGATGRAAGHPDQRSRQQPAALAARSDSG